jgi:hypothetical protein
MVAAPSGAAAAYPSADTVVAQPGGRVPAYVHAAVPGISSSRENDDDLEEMLGLLRV